MSPTPSNQQSHFATLLIMACGSAFIRNDFVVEEVRPCHVVYRRRRLYFSAQWLADSKTLLVNLGHRREAESAARGGRIGIGYNALLDAAGMAKRLPERIEDRDPVKAWREAFSVIAATLPTLVDGIRTLEPRAKQAAARSQLAEL